MKSVQTCVCVCMRRKFMHYFLPLEFGVWVVGFILYHISIYIIGFACMEPLK